MKALVETFAFSKFNYCPLVWLFTSMASTKKKASTQKRALRRLYNGYTSYYETLLSKDNKPTMEVKHFRILALEVFKTPSI